MADLIAMLSAAAGAAAGGGEVDPNFNQTVLLLHGDGTDGAQNNTFLDSSTNNFTITRNGNTTQGTFSPFSVANGQWSMQTASTGYLSFASNAAFAWGTGDFTMEAFVYATGLSGSNTTFFGSAPASEGQCCVVGTNASKYLRVQNNSTAFITDTVAFPEHEWVHVCVVRSGTDLSLYKNGVRVGTATNSNSFTSSGGARVGGDELLVDLPGYLSNVRYVKGTAVYDPTQTTLNVPTSPLTAISGTSLLVCQSNRFVDNSTNAFSMTLVGTNSIQPFSPFAPSAAYSTSVNGGSGYFDGTGDYLTVPNNTDLILGTGDCTIECWVYPLAVNAGNANPILNKLNGASNNGWLLGMSNTSLWQFSTGTNVIVRAGTVVLNAWTHLSAVRASGTTTLYVNGVSVGTTATVFDFTDTVDLLVGFNSSFVAANAYVSNARIIKGTAITPPVGGPTAPVTAVSGTELLLNFTNAGIFDNTGKNNLETVGNAQIDTATKKYGTGSMEFDGTGDELNIAGSQNFAFGTGDFTVEFWINSTQATTFDIMNVTGGWGMLYGGGQLYWQSATGASNLIQRTTNIIDGNWHHCAVTREGSTNRMFVDGVLLGATVSNSQNYTGAGLFQIGDGPYGDFNGLIDDLRITKGVARYVTSPFTPPDAPFPDQ